MSHKEKLMLAEHIVEIRHAAAGTFLDVRGYVADYIRTSGFLPHWSIQTNIVNFRDKEDKVEKEGGFVGYKSLGYFVYNADTKNFFADRANAFLKLIMENKHYTIPDMTRFGVRTKVFIPCDLTFEAINSKFFNRLFTEGAVKLIGGQEKDFQIIIDLIEQEFDVRLRGGPIHKNEAGKHLNFEAEQFKNAGIFLDIDYYKTKDILLKQTRKHLLQAIELTWNKVENIASELEI